MLWILSAVAMTLDWRSFADAVAQHEVLSMSALRALWAVPLVQFLQGSAMIIGCTHRRFGPIVCVSGLVLVAVFTAYLPRVPEETLIKTGCACMKPQLIRHDRELSTAWNAALACVHALAMFGTGARATVRPTFGEEMAAS